MISKKKSHQTTFRICLESQDLDFTIISNEWDTHLNFDFDFISKISIIFFGFWSETQLIGEHFLCLFVWQFFIFIKIVVRPLHHSNVLRSWWSQFYRVIPIGFFHLFYYAEMALYYQHLLIPIIICVSLHTNGVLNELIAGGPGSCLTFFRTSDYVQFSNLERVNSSELTYNRTLVEILLVFWTLYSIFICSLEQSSEVISDCFSNTNDGRKFFVNIEIWNLNIILTIFIVWIFLVLLGLDEVFSIGWA